MDKNYIFPNIMFCFPSRLTRREGRLISAELNPWNSRESSFLYTRSDRSFFILSETIRSLLL